MGQMTEKNLRLVAEISWPDYIWDSQREFKYDPTNKRKYYKIDCLSETRNVVWEYEGPDYYSNAWKLAETSSDGTISKSWG